ncbi:hypothetical protein P153DRAFT_371161 [Dothidotthia symphoricarpi CBS 119687]|uniref:Uncharacterized protein n=1 Tax=Dothidotthia symphoricarpi CBS 119687 TaxID=1392245 RepID=A0A6A6A022_9PLEO|nr:uncharacterized protein P153DRAFT_371161 [Dothidotthia symphoricarpi CBS 119687]KAF2124307.1 hypothetical protein P153DRAFT_371161 [Dothidotthia symphoricarpi CBS 119687]
MGQSSASLSCRPQPQRRVLASRALYTRTLLNALRSIWLTGIWAIISKSPTLVETTNTATQAQGYPYDNIPDTRPPKVFRISGGNSSCVTLGVQITVKD